MLALYVTRYLKKKWFEKKINDGNRISHLPATIVAKHLKDEVLKQPLHFLV